MKTNKRVLARFPGDGQVVTAGAFLKKENLLITGHANGLVDLWDLNNKSSKRLASGSSEIRTIACSEKNQLVIGTQYGDIIIATLDGDAKTIWHGTNTKLDRVWKCRWIDENKFVMTSSYGEVSFFNKDGFGKWVKTSSSAGSQSVFGLSVSPDGNYFATGDYHGNILIWDSKNQKQIDRLQVIGNIQGISWQTNECFSAINRDGRIYLFEKNHEWKQVSDLQAARSTGTSISISENGESVFGGTITDIIQLDTENLLSDLIEIPDTVEIFCHGNSVFVLTAHDFQEFERQAVDVKSELIKFKYVKIGVVGQTTAGKSNLCSQIIFNKKADGISTQGKKVWTWEPSNNSAEKIMFYDYGGQETALSTFLPFLVDSDIVLILYRQIDKHSLDQAIKILDALSDKVSKRTKFFLVQTHIDEPVEPEIDFRKVDRLKHEGKIIDNLKVSTTEGDGIPELKEVILSNISWKDARLMIQSVYSDEVLKTILDLQAGKATALKLDEFIAEYQKRKSLDIWWLSGGTISKTHARFLLQSYSNQGIIDYDPILDLLVIDDPEYNNLKSQVPISIMRHDGIASIESLRQEFQKNKYFDALDALYLKYEIAIENYGQRIFPELLKEDAITIPENLGAYFKGIPAETRLMQNQKIATEGLIDALSQLKLRCVTASIKDGLFSWEENAILYYRFDITGDAFEGYFLKVTYRIGGKNPQVRERLLKEFLKIIEQLYGSFQTALETLDKKKVKLVREVNYEVAISYASEQVQYATELNDELTRNGISTFFDKDVEAQLWGKDMTEFFHDIFYNQARFCIMIISEPYVTKAYPTFERKSAMARQVEQMGEYILPIRFDDSVVPGLATTINYLNASEKSPKDIANIMLQKLGSAK